MSAIAHNLATCRACRLGLGPCPGEHPAVPRCPKDGGLLTAHATSGACALGKLRAPPPPANDAVATTITVPSDPANPPSPLAVSPAPLAPPPAVRPPAGVPAAAPGGVGAMLKRILAEFKIVPTGGCGCNEMAAQMDAWGPAGCLDNMPAITAVLVRNAAARGMPADEETARNLVLLAIELSEQATANAPPTPPADPSAAPSTASAPPT